jgi:metal-sulfur cluster biosynthetic enzyme
VRMAEELVSRTREAIYAVSEEETGRKLGELTVVTEVLEVTPGVVKVRFTPLSAYSPTAVELGRRIKEAAGKVEGVSKTVIECDGHMQNELVNRLVNGP